MWRSGATGRRPRVNAIVNQAIADWVSGPPLKPAPTKGFRPLPFCFFMGLSRQ